jgi:hypothetical protein
MRHHTSGICIFCGRPTCQSGAYDERHRDCAGYDDGREWLTNRAHKERNVSEYDQHEADYAAKGTMR